MTPLSIGDRVRLVADVENYPVVIAKAGETGTITEIEIGGIWIKMDRDFPELEEWENQLQVWDFDLDSVAKE